MLCVAGAITVPSRVKVRVCDVLRCSALLCSLRATLPPHGGFCPLYAISHDLGDISATLEVSVCENCYLSPPCGSHLGPRPRGAGNSSIAATLLRLSVATALVQSFTPKLKPTGGGDDDALATRNTDMTN